mmetsp:Transcript_17995/g.56383  ORF Transcript_17995/g.56383 Transcript_17995/m.56383 type:complete len:232 (-) Transcript_17995:324-1019(-)
MRSPEASAPSPSTTDYARWSSARWRSSRPGQRRPPGPPPRARLRSPGQQARQARQALRPLRQGPRPASLRPSPGSRSSRSWCSRATRSWAPPRSSCLRLSASSSSSGGSTSRGTTSRGRPCRLCARPCLRRSSSAARTSRPSSSTSALHVTPASAARGGAGPCFFPPCQLAQRSSHALPCPGGHASRRLRQVGVYASAAHATRSAHSCKIQLQMHRRAGVVKRGAHGDTPA